MAYLKRWLGHYGRISGMPGEILALVPRIGAIEMNIKHYPTFRDPETYPMYGRSSIESLFDLSIDI